MTLEVRKYHKTDTERNYHKTDTEDNRVEMVPNVMSNFQEVDSISNHLQLASNSFAIFFTCFSPSVISCLSKDERQGKKKKTIFLDTSTKLGLVS